MVQPLQGVGQSPTRSWNNVLELAEKCGIEWPVDDDVTNVEPEKLFYPERETAGSHDAEPDYAYIHRELSKKGVTLTLLWQELSLLYYNPALSSLSKNAGRLLYLYLSSSERLPAALAPKQPIKLLSNSAVSE